METNNTNLSPSLRRLIIERDEFTCTECGQQVPKVLLYIDKILSPETEEAFAGQPEEDKYTCLCESCYKQAHGHLQYKEINWNCLWNGVVRNAALNPTPMLTS